MGQVACWLAAAIILVAGLFKLTTMQLTEPELFFGVLLTLAVALLGVVLGVLLPMAQSFDQWQRDRGNR